MQTLCEQLQEAGRLGGSFFFKRGHNTCGNAKVLFATLGYQLALHRHDLRGPISQSVETDPSVVGKSLDVQLRNLILEPCQLTRGMSPSALLIDGLDECDGHNIQREILHLMGSTANKHHLALRILVASRPEPHIWETFKEESLLGVADSTNIEQSFKDVWTYLRDEFSRIHREHLTAMQHIPTPWPAPEILRKLVQNSSGYFVYAATIIKFVDDEYSWPSKQLDIVVQKMIPHDSESPFATLDQLYMEILSRVPARYRPSLCNILCTITHYPEVFSVQDIDVLLGLELGTVKLIIRPLHSVLKIPALSGDLLGVHHASFLDFLKDETRSLGFYIGSAEHKAGVGHSILKVLAYTFDNPWKNLADLGLCWYV
ncbi:putative nwd2 protein [Mycena venus]|uniref:Putative nwd2 protein n=1 Tax=Mycena venus TaxID=2733690 RepID=A0A8H7CVL8_9AGAR|nr:putative nwd2 protein [Mycena venus]